MLRNDACWRDNDAPVIWSDSQTIYLGSARSSSNARVEYGMEYYIRYTAFASFCKVQRVEGMSRRIYTDSDTLLIV